MNKEILNKSSFQKGFLLALVTAISLVFFTMVRQYLVALLIAAILSGLVHPLYKWFLNRTRGRTSTSSILTLLVVFISILIPIATLVVIVAVQAVEVGNSIGPWIQERLATSGDVNDWVAQVPVLEGIVEQLRPYEEQISTRFSELAGQLGNILFSGITEVTTGTVTFVFQLFIMLYAMFFFLVNGRQTLSKILYYVPLTSDDEERMLDKFVSVTRATVKGSLIIGVLQGVLAGLGFWIAGIPSAVFWGTIMAVLSVIPAVGAALVWIPGVIYLFATGETGWALGLALWCGMIVGTVDNILRPKLVGKDTKMSDLLILLSTLGGIVLFGVVGFIIGPIVAALFVTVWDIYGITFKDWLPEVREIDISD
ncbi:MAG: AI-2E family transporter [Rhodothermales bacterium]|nr:AI-2E family transporter [Rhodothermales bacterium]